MSPRGGARPGTGPKPAAGEPARHILRASVTDAQLAWAEHVAEHEGLTLAEWQRSLVDRAISEHTCAECATKTARPRAGATKVARHGPRRRDLCGHLQGMRAAMTPLEIANAVLSEIDAGRPDAERIVALARAVVVMQPVVDEAERWTDSSAVSDETVMDAVRQYRAVRL
jgi:hypothetical protein